VTLAQQPVTPERTGFLKLADCEHCPLCTDAKPVAGSGPSKAQVVLVGEAPGREEIQKGEPFTGKSGYLLDMTLADIGMPRPTVFVTNTVLCRPPTKDGKDVPPPAEAIKCCSKRLEAEVRSRSPEIVVTLGGTAGQAMLDTKEPVSKFQGVLQWNERFGAFALPTYHPAAVIHGGTGFFDDIYISLQRAHRLVSGKTPFPPKRHKLDYTFYGTRGTQIPRGRYWTWSGFWEPSATAEEADRWRMQSAELIRWWIRRLDKRNGQPMYFGLDTEGRSTKYYEPMTMIQIYDGDRSYAWPWWLISEQLELFQQLLNHPNARWIIHNTSHDRQVIRYWMKVDLGDRDLCTLVLGLGLTERGEQVGLKYMARQWMNAPYYEEKLEEWLPNRECPFDCVPPDILAEYGCEDCYYCFHLGKLLPQYVRDEGTMQLCKELLLPAQRAFGDGPEYHGTLIDMDYAATLEAEWLPMIETAVEKVQDYASAQGFPKDPQKTAAQTMGVPCPECVVPFFNLDKGGMVFTLLQGERKGWRDELKATSFGDPSCRKCMKRRFILVPDNKINVRSSVQMQHLAFDMLRMKQGKDGRSCNEDFWDTNSQHPLTKLVMEYRETDHLLRNYVRGIGDDVGPDGRIHPDFLLFGTVTGRLAIHNPPLQTIPKWGVNPEKAKLIRKMFRASPGHVIVDVDYKNLELFIAWHYSGDANLARALTEQDFHTATAAAIFEKPYDLVTGGDRFNSKFVTFGIAYGRQAYSLANGELFGITGGSERKAQEYIDRFWALYPRYADCYFGWQEEALSTGQLTTTLGRKRRWRLITPATRNHIMNQAVNFPIQSLASDTCLSALIRLNRILPELDLGRVLFTCHDSLVFEVREERLDEACLVIEREMLSPPYETEARFAVDIEWGPSLGEVQRWTRPELALAA